MDEKELEAKKVAEALNAAKSAEGAVKEQSEVLKSVNATLEKVAEAVVKMSETPKESEAVLEMKSQIVLISEQMKARNSGSLETEHKQLEVKSLETVKSFQGALINKGLVTFGKDGKESAFNNCGILERKSLQTFNNSNAGAFVPAKRILGDLNINLITSNPVTSVVNNVAAGAIVAGELAYRTYDNSKVAMDGTAEGVGATETDEVKMGEIDIYVGKNSAKIKISDKTLHSSLSGELSTDPLAQNMQALDEQYEKKIARKVLNGVEAMGIQGIFPKALMSDFRGKVVPTSTGNKVILSDLLLLTSQIKGAYLRNAAILIDRAALHEIYLEPGNDGHLKIEQFDYSTGIAALRTAEGIIPLIGVDSSFKVADIANNDGFANYTPFSGSVAASALAGYTPSLYASASGATDNEGKAVAVLADFSKAYSLARSSVVQMGYDNSFGNLLNDGYVWGGKIGYVGGKPTTTEAIAVLYVQ